MARHANDIEGNFDVPGASACHGLGTGRHERLRGWANARRVFAHDSALESPIPPARIDRVEDAFPVGATDETVVATASRLGTASGARRGSAGVQHRSLDLPTDRHAHSTPLRCSLSCRSSASATEKLGLLGPTTGTQSPRTRRTGYPRLDRARLATDQKKAARCRGTLVFIDETGVFLTPFLRRTWAPRGQTPILHTRTRHHRHVSLIGGISISPRRRRLGWLLNFHADKSIRQEQVIAFLRDLTRHIRGEVFVIWDRLNAHRGKKVRFFLARRARLHTEFLPPYAPELNPNEYGWGYLKCTKLANYAPDNLGELQVATKKAAAKISSTQKLLRGFIQATGLPIRLPERR
jgi:putative transposase